MRDAFELEKMYVDQVQYESQAETMTVAELLQQDFERSYLIPDLLPNPAVVLIYGAGGDGKSMAAWTLAKHVATGAAVCDSGAARSSAAGSGVASQR
jgi:SpoVK/Ycf46/Vps4 family AAA+-type ATPase